MGGDYERFTFDPFKNYAGVFEQQGRVKLSADWNEQVQLIDRRWRAETIDILGRCIVPDSTPDAFRITPTGSGTFMIGIGRMYVDGLLAECHGLEPLIYDDSLSEQRGTTEIPYTDQPYFPAPVPPELPGTEGTTDLVYLHVWQREVTAIEDPEIQEKALDGPDTATRIQTAWQVGVLPDVGDLSCADPLAAWDALTAPSAGRLTTAAIAPPASDDPCILSPSGGYRGLENRFYRVEIHQAGALGTARFKWSRDNGSIVAAVEAISAGQDQLTISSLGRDQVLRFQVDDWIEVWDDPLEFSRAAGLADTAGHLARITNIDEANRILTIQPAIPASFNFDATEPDRHTRVRKWDQQSADGLLDVTAGTIDLEDGVQISFSTDPANGEFKVGDSWNFYARTVDGSVELLQAAPPHSILHHYCRLALITWGDTVETTAVSDCRIHPSPCCEGFCTVTVGDGIDSEGDFTDIQEAIDSLDSRGGVVCIGRGVFPVSRSIRLGPSNRRITIRGTGLATCILFTPEENTSESFMLLRSTEHIRIESLFVVSLSARNLINANSCHFCTVQDCALVNLNVQTEQEVVSGRGIELLGNCVGWKIERNAILAAKGIVSTASGETEKVSDLQIWNNRFLIVQGAVLIQNVEQLSIRHNRLEGLEQVVLQDLQAFEPLSREIINAFQLQVSQAFRRTVEFDVNRFQAIGILIVSGNRIEISHNLISAQVGILIFLGINAQLIDNQLLALIGFLLVFGILIHLADSLVLALWIGLLQVGIVVDLLCENNLWFGFFGIALQSLAETVESLAPLLGNALVNGGFSNKGAQTVDATLTQGQAAVGGLNAFGLATTVKVHHNLFFNFFRGIYKSDAVVSADFSFIDNTFTLCGVAAIELGQLSEVIFQEQGRSLIPRHLIQGNGFTVTGRGIVSASVYTFIQDNSITCPQVAIKLDCANSTIRNNLLRGTARETAANVGLIMVSLQAQGLRIVGNHLQGGPGHGILIDARRLSNLVIEDNVIEFMRQNGISTINDSSSVNDLRISRNTIQQCLVGAANAIPWMSGAIVISGGRNVQITENDIHNNVPNPNAGKQFYAIYGQDLSGIYLMHNVLSENVPNPASSLSEVGGIRLNFVRDEIKVIGNTIRNNGGQALVINAEPSPQQRAIVQGNHFISELDNRFLILVLVDRLEHLQFENNQVAHSPVQLGQVSLPASTLLRGALLIVHGNTVRSINNQSGLGIVATAGSSSRGILSSNLTTGLPQIYNYPFGTLAQTHNLQLP